MYISSKNGDWFCSYQNIVCNLEYGHSFGCRTFRFTRGKWHRLGQYLKLNPPGGRDGEIRMQFDGKDFFELGSLIFRKDFKVKIDTLYFNTFFGVSTSDWASTPDMYTYHKNFTISLI